MGEEFRGATVGLFVVRQLAQGVVSDATSLVVAGSSVVAWAELFLFRL